MNIQHVLLKPLKNCCIEHAARRNHTEDDAVGFVEPAKTCRRSAMLDAYS
jgi:hypothetical protein